jgi:ATPase subunit of ABC transporter with duplicated ATPase domains
MPNDLETQIREALQQILDRYDGPMILAPRIARLIEITTAGTYDRDRRINAALAALQAEIARLEGEVERCYNAEIERLMQMFNEHQRKWFEENDALRAALRQAGNDLEHIEAHLTRYHNAAPAYIVATANGGKVRARAALDGGNHE